MTSHRERLHAPLSWWIGAGGFSFTWGWLVFVVGGWPVAVVTATGVAIIVSAALIRFGAAPIVVDGDLTAGRARLDAAHIGEVTRLDREAYRHLMGPGANAHALLITRPWIDRGVRVEIDDAGDPTPYWLIGSREPDALTTALRELRAQEPTPNPPPSIPDGGA